MTIFSDTTFGALRPAVLYAPDEPPAGDPPPADPPADPPAPKDDQAAAFAAIRRELAAEKRAREAAERKVEERERAEAEQQGKWKEIAEASDAKVKELETRIARGELQALVGGIAKRLQFADPEDAFRFLDEADMGDEKLAERALKSLAKDKPYLLARGPKRTGRETTGGDHNDDNEPKVPLGADGKPDLRAGLGQGLLAALDDMQGRGLIRAGRGPDDD